MLCKGRREGCVPGAFDVASRLLFSREGVEPRHFETGQWARFPLGSCQRGWFEGDHGTELWSRCRDGGRSLPLC